MIDVERLVRDALARQEAEVPLPEPFEARSVAVRSRRRQVMNAVGAGLIALVIALGASSGIGALRAEGPKPADDPTETPSPTDLDIRGPFEAPSRAPIVVGSGQTKQWPWMLSSSADGRCLGFTNEEGSQVNCSGPSGEPIDAYIYAPRGKTIAFAFGRVPRETNSVTVDVPSRLRTTGTVFLKAAKSLQLPYSFFVANIGGYYEYPWVPNATISAGDAVANTVIASGEPERPAWARAPFTVIATVASGIHRLHPAEGELPEPWEIDIFRDERTGEVCLGEPGEQAACGTADDPVAGWMSTWSSFERVNIDNGPMGLGASPQFMWGVFRDPVASIEVELLDPAGMSPGWQPADADIHRLPTGYGDAFSIFVVDCDCWGVRVHQLAADGSEIAVERIW